MAENVDKQIKKLIKSCIKSYHRSLFVILGAKGSQQVPVFIQLLMQRKIDNMSCLWCVKEQSLIFEKENKANLVKKLSHIEGHIPDPYYCSYSDIDKIAHRSFNVAVLQDFDALSPKTVSSVIQAVEGGGIILFLLHDIKSLNDLPKLNLNVDYKPSRFCKRFSALLISCPDSMILDENLSILSCGPKSSENLEENSLTTRTKKLEEIMSGNRKDDAITARLLSACLTPDQAEILVKFLDVLKKKTPHSVFTVSSPVGRGKSSALGLAIAGGLALNYSNIFVSSMSYNNVKSVFASILKGLDALHYEEDKDFDVIQSINPKFGKAVIGINLFRDHPQSVRFILPGDIDQKLEQAELVILDEAAGIPEQILKPLLGPYVILMASSISGIGSSSPYLYNSMITSVEKSFAPLPFDSDKLQTLELCEPINYSEEDHIESWINNVLQVEPSMTKLLSCGFPIPDQCGLFHVNLDILFSGSSQAENFLKSLISVLSASERVIKPDQFLKLADSPNHHLFCLLPPINNSTKSFPGIITAIVVHLENEIPENIIHCGTNLNDNVTHCFNEWKSGSMTSHPKFLPVLGIHVENIVTHPSYRKMGYGMRAFQLLQDFYEGKCISLDESLDTRCKLNDDSEQNMAVDSGQEAALLQQLTEVQPENIDYILVTCSFTSQSLRFWKKAAFVPAFITNKVNSEGDHYLFMIKGTKSFEQKLQKIWSSFQKHFYVLLGSVFKYLPASLALNLVHFNVESSVEKTPELTKECIDVLIKPHRMKSLMKYCQNLQDFHSVLQFIPIVSNLYFKNYFKDISLSRVQEAILLSFGLQFKIADEISKDLGLPNIQIHGLLNRTIKKLVKYLNDIIEKSVEKTLENPEVVMEPITENLNEELEEAAKKIQEQQESDAKKLLDIDISQYAIKGSEDDWQKALFSGRKALVSIKSIKKTSDSTEKDFGKKQNFKKNNKQKKQRK